MELRHLRSFLALAREKHFTRAASHLHISQPPFSQRIRELEAYLGVPLFERTTRHVALTAAGTVLHKRVTSLLRQLEDAVDECRLLHAGMTQTLRIGYTGRISHTWLPALMRTFQRKYPAVRITLTGPSPTAPLCDGLLCGDLDAALCFLPVKARGIRTRTLTQTDFLLALPQGHKLARHSTLSLTTLRDEVFIAHPQGFRLREATDSLCARAHFVPRVIEEPETSQALLCLVGAGAGVAIILREIQAMDSIAGVTYREITPTPRKLAHGIAWLERNRNPALHSLLTLKMLNPS